MAEDDFTLDDDPLEQLDLVGEVAELAGPTDSKPERLNHQEEEQKAFMTALLAGQTTEADVDELIRRNFSTESFLPTIKPKIDFVLKHYREHRCMPRTAALLKHFPAFTTECLLPPNRQSDLLEQDVPLHALYREVSDGALLSQITDAHAKVAEAYHSSDIDVDGIWGVYEEQYRAIARVRAASRRQAKTLTDALSDVKVDFELAKVGRTWGIPIPFPFLHTTLRGFQKAELTTIVGRSGVGKTWFALMCVVAALVGDPFFFTSAESLGIKRPEDWRKQCLENMRKVLLVSLEMPIPQIARRLASLLMKLPYPQIRAGRFNIESDEARFYKKLEMLQDPKQGLGENCLITTATTVDEVAADADAFGADLVVVDGFYLMAGAGEKRWERVQDNMQHMRVHSLTSQRHYLLISQLARKDEQLAFSQSIEQDSSTVVVLNQSPAERNRKTVRLGTRKVRDGTVGEEYYYSMDVDQSRYVQEGPVGSEFDEDT